MLLLNVVPSPIPCPGLPKARSKTSWSPAFPSWRQIFTSAQPHNKVHCLFHSLQPYSSLSSDLADLDVFIHCFLFLCYMTFVLNAKQHKELIRTISLEAALSFIPVMFILPIFCILSRFSFFPSNGSLFGSATALLLFSGLQETCVRVSGPLNASSFIFVELVPHCSCSKEKLH